MEVILKTEQLRYPTCEHYFIIYAQNSTLISAFEDIKSAMVGKLTISVIG